MKLSVEERQIMVSLEYEKAQSFLEQAEKIAAMYEGLLYIVDSC